jgi:hypothetical protein
MAIANLVGKTMIAATRVLRSPQGHFLTPLSNGSMPKTKTVARWISRMCFWAGPLAVLYGQSIKTGPEVGQQVPAFVAQDQNGRTETFRSITGPKGAMLVFFRSADW